MVKSCIIGTWAGFGIALLLFPAFMDDPTAGIFASLGFSVGVTWTLIQMRKYLP